MRSSAAYILAPLAALAGLANGAPIHMEVRDVFVPTILEPVANVIWTKGSTQSVVWDVTDAPEEISNPIGKIYLRDVTQEIILLDSPLATGFDILEGKHEVVVPTDVPAGPYQIVLFGNSGNWSPAFSIVD